MSTRRLLEDTAERIFTDHISKATLDAAEGGAFPIELQELLTANGYHEMGLPDSGVPLADAFAVLKVAGRFAVPLPLAELVLGNRWLGRADGLANRFVSVGRRAETGAVMVPWGRNADLVLAVDEESLVLLDVASVTQGANLAGEPRDEVAGTVREALSTEDDPFALMALARAMLMAGGLERVLALSLQYANEREQFGRPIARFQAVQHNLAVMAAEVAAATRAADAAADSLSDFAGDRARQRLEVAAAKSRVGEACGVVAEIAQQVHGAMGFTYEHQLHHFTRRLWAWRDEYGAEGYWQRLLGNHLAELAAAGDGAVWDFFATRS